MIYRFGTYEIDAQRGELRRAGQPVAIEPKVFDVLLYLLEHRDHVITKEELLDHCWPETYVTEAALTRCLAKVRKAVHSDQASVPVIKTVYGRGYRFVAPLTSVAPEPLPPVTPASGDKTPATVERGKILIVDDEPFNVDYPHMGHGFLRTR